MFLRSKKQLKKIVKRISSFLSSIGIILFPLSCVSFSKQLSHNFLPQTNMSPKNIQNGLILQKPHYEQKFIKKLNQDIQTAKEPTSTTAFYNYKVDKSEQQTTTYSEILGKYYYKFGQGYAKGATYSQNLGNYSYNTKTESGWQINNSREFNHNNVHRTTCFDQKGIDVWSNINLYKNNSYQTSITENWDIQGNMNPTWKFDYNFDLGWSFDKNDVISLQMEFRMQDAPPSDNFFFFKKRVSDIYSFPRGVTSIYLERMQFDFLIDADWKSGGYYNDVHFYYKRIDTTFRWKYKYYQYQSANKIIHAKPVYLAKDELKTYKSNPSSIYKKIHFQNPINLQELHYGSQITFSNLQIDEKNQKIIGNYYIYPGTFGSTHHSSNWKYFILPFKFEIEDMFKKIIFKKVYLKKDYLIKHNFNTKEIENLIHLKASNDNYELDHGSKVIFSSLIVDKNNSEIKGRYYIYPGTFGKYAPSSSNWQNFSIPINHQIVALQKNFIVKPVFISVQDLENHIFSKQELINLIQFESIDKSNVVFSDFQVDRKNKKIIATYEIKNLNKNQSDISYQKLEIPIKAFDFNYLFTLSPESASQWQHLANGKIKYWQNPPKTIVTYNNDWIKSFYIFNKKQETQNKFNHEKGSWNFKDQDQNIVAQKINSFAINFWNYEEIKQKYLANKSTSYLQSLQPKPFLEVFKQLNNVSFSDYLWTLKQETLYFDIKENNVVSPVWLTCKLNYFEKKVVSLIPKQIEPTATKTNWKFQVHHFHLVSLQPNIFNSGIYLKFKAIKNKNYEKLYDVKIYVDPMDSTIMYHEYFFQAQGFDIKKDVSFVMEDGTVLNQNYIVVKARQNSHLKMGDNGFANTRYWTHFSTGVECFVTLIKKGTTWFSPKYQKTIQELDKTFNPEKLEWVFNQTLKMVINPYNKKTGGKITGEDEPRYGIEKVTDFFNSQTKLTLESWATGKWSHTAKKDGKALFDGIFGADTNGQLDPVGFLGEGNHQITVNLKVAYPTLKNHFNITIDKNPVKIKISSMGQLKKTFILDQNNQNQELWFANNPINILVNEVDLASIKAWMLRSNGTWYQIPVAIKSVLRDKKWVQQIDTTFDYEGFAKIVISDQVGNEKTFFLQTNKNINEKPSIKTDKKTIYKKTIFKGKQLTICKNQIKLKIANPLVKNVLVNKVTLNSDGQVVKEEQKATISDYEIMAPPKYEYGKTLTSEKKRLPYGIDELAPFLKRFKQITSEKWKTCNKQISLNKDSLYEVCLKTSLVDCPIITKYFYINKDQKVILIDSSKFKKESSCFEKLPSMPVLCSFAIAKQALNLTNIQVLKKTELKDNVVTKKLIIEEIKKSVNYKSLTADKLATLNALLKVKFLNLIINSPLYKAVFQNKGETLTIIIDQVETKTTISKSKQSKENEKWILSEKDKIVNWLKEFHVNLFNFEIKSLNIDYSLPWYCEFSKTKWIWGTPFKEGKYKITFEDTFGNLHTYEFLLINKKMSVASRKVKQIIQIYAEDQNEKTAFWKGDFVWNFWRYEDEDHAKWEHTKFIKDFIAAGFTPKEAEQAYHMAKYDAHWDGSFKSGPPKTSGDKAWKSFLKDQKWKKHVKEQKKTLSAVKEKVFSPQSLKPFLPQKITSIPPYKYRGQKLPQGFKIPKTVTKIGEGAFQDATLPPGFSLPPTIKIIGPHAFDHAKLPEGFTIPKSVTDIGEGTFKGTTLPKGFSLPPTIKKIGPHAFDHAKIPQGFKIPKTVTKIGEGAFQDASLPSSFNVPKTVEQIGKDAFKGTSWDWKSGFDKQKEQKKQLQEQIKKVWTWTIVGSSFLGILIISLMIFLFWRRNRTKKIR